MTWGKERNKLGPCQDKREGTEVGIHGGVGGAVSGDDYGIGEAMARPEEMTELDGWDK